MPELPEVETIRRVLEPQLQNRTIEKVTVNHKDAVAYPSVDDFCLGLTGQMVSHIQRRGKFLIICMKSGDRVILHLRMTGGLLFTPKNYPEEKYTHLIFHFDQGQKLLFSDMRRFGRFWFLKKEEKDTFSGIAKLGIEPFDPKLSADYLKTYLGTRKKAIKTCLLDQSIIAGIGNIYSDEILFAAKILPSRPANSLTDKEWKCLTVTIPERLEYFIEKNAISAEDYLETKGKDYRNTPFLRIYGHSGEPCPVCGSTLCRTTIGGRSSVYCERCQQ